jgi:nitrite reductase/ring-hydroxylating ferredoxin subunit
MSQLDPSLTWYRVAPPGYPEDGGRLHARVDGRYVTVFKHKNQLSAIDAICHHAGGPLTLGPIQDIEDLGVTVVLCPWHKFMVTVDQGLKAYQAVTIQNGKPVAGGWKLGKMVQRAHKIVETDAGIFVSLVLDGPECSADHDACSALCAQDYPLTADVSQPFNPHK